MLNQNMVCFGVIGVLVLFTSSQAYAFEGDLSDVLFQITIKSEDILNSGDDNKSFLSEINEYVKTIEPKNAEEKNYCRESYRKNTITI
ncbi:hypothetical protein [Candidatus Nitrosarchaeum limnium]|jgi:hypothetical protein|uniref:Uncharacterized protein n=1 Tax=Candidatus Nitrosarchaeum limnium BG20 TaxID=859192 RepID=S2EUS5_9ARCH|nr:hypothetical protein [Candidatus Nitrosarchaeum limnium]EPA06044.1 hypothetical protein BG20_I0618 [Candidatus Nitrosarchaeum limnium BG20]